jgi:ferritin-like metal-binding protein YciE
MSAKNLSELLIEELRDAYDGEKRLTRALPKMAKAASSEELSAAFMTHLRETEGQIARLEQVFKILGEAPRGKKCEGIMGIVEEGEQAMQELDGPVLDAALIAGAQKVEHYEIASYGTVAYFAELLGETRAKDLLGQTLEEEKAADEKLTTLAASRVNREALLAAGSEDDRMSRAVAHDRSPRRRSRKSTGRSSRSNRKKR